MELLVFMGEFSPKDNGQTGVLMRKNHFRWCHH